jgi:hypothetical protein
MDEAPGYYRSYAPAIFARGHLGPCGSGSAGTKPQVAVTNLFSLPEICMRLPA